MPRLLSFSILLLFGTALISTGLVTPVSAMLLDGLAGKCSQCHIQEPVGSEVCLDCHKADYAQWEEGQHGPDRGDVQCEQCHGSGIEHVDDPYNLLKIINLRNIPVTPHELEKSYTPIEYQSAFCAMCHMQKYIEIKSTPSMYRVTSCPVCHNSHGSENTAATVRPGDKLCTRCHSLVPGNILSLSPIHNINTVGYNFIDHEDAELQCKDCHMPAESEETSHRMVFKTSSCIDCHPRQDRAWVSSKIPEWKIISEEHVMHPVPPSLVGEVKSTSEMREELYTTWHSRTVKGISSRASIVAVMIVFAFPLILWMRKEDIL